MKLYIVKPPKQCLNCEFEFSNEFDSDFCSNVCEEIYISNTEEEESEEE